MKLIRAIIIITVFLTLISGGVFLVYKIGLGQNQKGLSKNVLIDIPAAEIPKEYIENPEVIKALKKTREDQVEVSILAVGDIMLSRSVETLMKNKNNWSLPFEKTKEITSSADIAFGNLETSIFPGRQIQTGEFAFRVDPQAIHGLLSAGFDVLSLANNHTPNFGEKGLINTFDVLKDNNIEYVGAGKNKAEASLPVIIEKNGLKFGFLAYSYSLYVSPSYFAKENFAGINPMDSQKMAEDVLALKPQVDFVIVSMHDGTEYEPLPVSSQKDFARKAIESGASLVLGSHPHVVQTMEKYKEGYIFYSLGNFVFDQMWSEPTRQGLAVKAIFNKSGIKRIELLPIYINKNYQPVLAENKLIEQILNRLDYKYDQIGELFFEENEFKIKSFAAINNQTLKFENIYQSFDLNQDGNNEEAIVFDNVGYLLSEGKIIWQTNDEWEVENVYIGDFNNDKKPELGFSLWKAGSYGPAKPFWVEQNDSAISNHLFLFQMQGEDVNMIWGSSALDYPIKEMRLKDFGSNGSFDLMVWQGECGAYEKNCEKGGLGVWRWNKFGFYNVFQSPILSSFLPN